MNTPEPALRALRADRDPVAETPEPKLLRYAVIYSGSVWRVLSARAQIGRYPSRAEAMAVAVKLTRQALEAGQMSELYAQDEAGDFALHPLFPPRRRG